jgi:hypothetical protein
MRPSSLNVAALARCLGMLAVSAPLNSAKQEISCPDHTSSRIPDGTRLKRSSACSPFPRIAEGPVAISSSWRSCDSRARQSMPEHRSCISRADRGERDRHRSRVPVSALHGTARGPGCVRPRSTGRRHVQATLGLFRATARHSARGNRGFSLRIYTNAGNEADWARVREVMLKLGRLGSSRLT